MITGTSERARIHRQSSSPSMRGIIRSRTTAFAFAVPATAATPAKQPVVPGFFQGRTITYYDYGPVKLKPGNKLAPIWTVTNGAAGQHNIIDTVPGKTDYSPLWQLNMVTFTSGTTPHLLKSKAEVDAAVKAGAVTLTSTTTRVNCPVLR